MGLAASFLTLPARGARLIDSATKCLESGLLEAQYDEIKTIIVARDRFLPMVRKLENRPKVDLEFVVELRAECHDPELRDWCHAKLAKGSPKERAAAMRGLYRIGVAEDVKDIFIGLEQDSTERWAALTLGRLKVKEAIPLLIGKLGRPQQTGGASSPPGLLTVDMPEACQLALQDFGPEVVPYILPLIHPGIDESVIVAACKIVRRFRAGEACDRVYEVAKVRLAQLRSAKKPTFEQYMEMRELIFTLRQFSDPRSTPFEKAIASTRYSTDRGVDLEPDPNACLATLVQPGQPLSPDIRKVLDHEPELAAEYVLANFASIEDSKMPELLHGLVSSSMSKDLQFQVLDLAARSGSALTRRYACDGLGQLLWPAADKTLLRLVIDPDPDVRRQAIEASAILIGVPIALSRIAPP